MQKIPKSFDVQMKYQEQVKTKEDIYKLSPLERLILGQPIFNPYQEWIFRRRLNAVLKEGLKYPRTEVKMLRFIDRYTHTAPAASKLGILLSDALIDYREAAL